jgi:Na+(H+)/acetate symporter ActP
VFAAFLSTASGLLVSISGTISYDLWGRVRRPRAASDRRRRFRASAAIGMVLPVAVALGAAGLDIGVLVGWAFAIAASTFCPMFLLGVWWRGLTAAGAAAGMTVGALLATGAIFTGLAVDAGSGTIGTLLAQPAVVSVPLAFATMIGVSLATGERRPDADAQLLALHAPEGLGLEQLERAGVAAEPGAPLEAGGVRQ